MKDGYYRTIYPPHGEVLIKKVENDRDDTGLLVEDELARGVVFEEVIVLTLEQYNIDIQGAINSAFERGYHAWLAERWS